MTSQTVLILGSNGKFGRNAAKAFTDAGWQVTQFDRARDNLEKAVSGVDVVVNAWNPKDYSRWDSELRPMHDAVRNALKGSDTLMVLPGNVYVYGDQTGADWSEATPHRAANRLGELRIQIEAAYREAGIRTLIVRGGDYLDIAASGNWFDKVMVAGLPKGNFTYPGPADARHAWAFLPDIARATVQLAEQRDQLPRFLDVPFPGYTLTAAQIADALSAVTGGPVHLRRMPWWPLRLLGLFSAPMRHLHQMQYLWNLPHALDSSAFDTLLPEFQHTPLHQALGQATAHLNIKTHAERSLSAKPA